MKRFIQTLLSTAFLTCSGCMIPPILFPKTSIHGYVVDQYGNPVTNAVIEARSNPPRLLLWTEPLVIHHTRSNKDGRWAYSERKVGNLYLEVTPPIGYEPGQNPTNDYYQIGVGPFSDGDCPTNDFILLLKKLPEVPAGGRQ